MRRIAKVSNAEKHMMIVASHRKTSERVKLQGHQSAKCHKKAIKIDKKYTLLLLNDLEGLLARVLYDCCHATLLCRRAPKNRPEAVV